MGRRICTSIFVSAVWLGLVGTAWGGWFSFEPNIILTDGAYVARELEDLAKETEYIKTGNTANADEMIRDSRVLIIDSQKHENRVEFIEFTEQGENVFVLVQDESGTKMWANMVALVCQDSDGTQRPVAKEDLAKGEFPPLAKK